MPNERLIQELQKRGLLTEEDAKKLNRDVLLSGRSAEEFIHERKLVEDETLAQIKSELLNVPYRKVKPENITEELMNIIPEETVRTYQVVPLSKEGKNLIVGMLNPDDPKAQEALKFIGRRYGLNLGVYLISYDGWQKALQKYSPYQATIQEAVAALGIDKGLGVEFVELEEEARGVKEEAPIIRIVADTIKEAVQIRASDIHIEPQQTYLRIRFRIDGDLKEVAALPLQISSAVVSRVKVISNLKIDETRIPQDGRFRARIFDRQVDFRVSTFPTALGEKVAIRILDPLAGLRTIEELNLVEVNLNKIKSGLEKPYGLILVTGPTGSGKTTTIYAMLQVLNTEEVNIVSLEDPVEYSISGLNQSQVKPEIGYTFAAGLRQILRQDPDIISVGEIRDEETAELAIHAALTGHIVVSTLHTNNAIGAIPRLIDMGIQHFLIPSALNMVTAQRLLSMLCQNCKKEKEISPAVSKIIEEEMNVLPPALKPKPSPPYKIYDSPGCAKCKNKGVSGRIAIMEVLEMTSELADIISSGKITYEKLKEEAHRQGMVTMRQDGILKALEGLVSIEEVLRETKAEEE